MSLSSNALSKKEKVIACIKYFNAVTGYEPKSLIASVNKYANQMMVVPYSERVSLFDFKLNVIRAVGNLGNVVLMMDVKEAVETLSQLIGNAIDTKQLGLSEKEQLCLEIFKEARDSIQAKIQDDKTYANKVYLESAFHRRTLVHIDDLVRLYLLSCVSSTRSDISSNSRVSANQLDLSSSSDSTARTLYITMVNIVATASTTENLDEIVTEFWSATQKEGESVGEFSIRLRQLVGRAAKMEHNITEEELKARLVKGVFQNNVFRQTLITQASMDNVGKGANGRTLRFPDYTFERLVNMLSLSTENEDKRDSEAAAGKAGGSEMALATQLVGQKRKTMYTAGRLSCNTCGENHPVERCTKELYLQNKCYECHEVGHRFFECPQKAKKIATASEIASRAKNGRNSGNIFVPPNTGFSSAAAPRGRGYNSRGLQPAGRGVGRGGMNVYRGSTWGRGGYALSGRGGHTGGAYSGPRQAVSNYHTTTDEVNFNYLPVYRSSETQREGEGEWTKEGEWESTGMYGGYEGPPGGSASDPAA